jgi:hypothetical protein
MRSYQVFALAGVVASTTPDVFYYKNHNHDQSSEIADGLATLREWESGFTLFDSTSALKVQRLEVTGTPGSSVSLYPEPSHLSLAAGPMYFFSNATALTIEDKTTGTSHSASADDCVVWISQNSCVHLTVEIGTTGVASLMAVTAQDHAWDASTANDECGALEVLIGNDGLRDNNVPYELTPANSCDDGATHRDTPGYSNLDEPIGPLAAHYHTRGALYYVQYGLAKFNDANVEDDTITGGELRFVNSGVWYGPEEMDRSSTFCASVHEADPFAILAPSARTAMQAAKPAAQCPFACFGEVATPGVCKLSSEVNV